ncbi:hypothetical protein Y032_0297g1724 [Ancylostoma ceylanicum]|uniref:C-type lectin domain-containing protein n=1 Tax=Ancylostoma ceylanicum TaxID=53326 RepID=A0A016S497_9BILA|nr:hypothetical protein Y032_0297g1724 [Ancylostoma ceylanicum]
MLWKPNWNRHHNIKTVKEDYASDVCLFDVNVSLGSSIYQNDSCIDRISSVCTCINTSLSQGVIITNMNLRTALATLFLVATVYAQGHLVLTEQFTWKAATNGAVFTCGFSSTKG